MECNVSRRREVMGILNVTPDSFYDRSRAMTHSAICARTEQMLSDGVDIIDIGGSSSRPGAEPIAIKEEWHRVELGFDAVRSVSSTVRVSIDTFQSEVVAQAYDRFGEFIVNDISAGEADGRMFAAVAQRGLPYIVMHMRGTPQTMAQQTDYVNIIEEVQSYLRNRVEQMVLAGIDRNRIMIDPGFGFAKTVEQNYELLAQLHTLNVLDLPIVVGLSRKSMIYKPLGIDPDAALSATQALHWEALRQGASVLRTHDVREARQIIKMFEIFAGYEYNQDYGTM